MSIERKGATTPPIEIEIDTTVPPRAIERSRENVRERIVVHLTWCVTLVIVTSLATATVYPDRVQAIKDLLLIMMPGLFGSYGTALGFYFGQKK